MGAMRRPSNTDLSSVPAFRFSSLGDLQHAISSRHGGVSPSPFATLNLGLSTGDLEDNVLTNRERLVESLGISMDDVVVGRLSHGNQVSVFRRDGGDFPIERVPLRSGSRHRVAIFRSDAIISDVPGLSFLLTFADCVPLVFWDERRGVVGAAHAGWRGTALGIGQEVVRAMAEAFGANPADLRAGVGPSIGPCCYSVQPQVTASFESNGFDPTVQERAGATYLDLWESNEQQLTEVGVRAESIENPRICTSCNTSDFYSHRAEGGRTGRFALCIGRS